MDNKIEFFKKRLGDKLESLKSMLDKRPVVLFFLAKKNAGKGTYSKLLNEVTEGRIYHISVGDLVREAGQKLESEAKSFIKEVKSFYDGSESVEKLGEIFRHGAKQTKNLLPTSAIVALIKRAISKIGNKSAVIDGFPRGIDQVDLAVAMKEKSKQDGKPSCFVEIDCADEILLARLMNRRICPTCQTPKHIELLLTKEIEYDPKTEDFHLICDNKECGQARMIRKQGDADGPEVIKERQTLMAKLFDMVKQKAGSDYLMVKNHIPVTESHKHAQDDFTTSAKLAWNKEKSEVERKFVPWVIKDENGSEIYSRWPEPVVVDLALELHNWLESEIRRA